MCASCVVGVCSQVVAVLEYGKFARRRNCLVHPITSNAGIGVVGYEAINTKGVGGIVSKDRPIHGELAKPGLQPCNHSFVVSH